MGYKNSKKQKDHVHKVHAGFRKHKSYRKKTKYERNHPVHEPILE